jgi:hypothetical protein
MRVLADPLSYQIFLGLSAEVKYVRRHNPMQSATQLCSSWWCCEAARCLYLAIQYSDDHDAAVVSAIVFILKRGEVFLHNEQTPSNS